MSEIRRRGLMLVLSARAGHLADRIGLSLTPTLRRVRRLDQGPLRVGSRVVVPIVSVARDMGPLVDDQHLLAGPREIRNNIPTPGRRSAAVASEPNAREIIKAPTRTAATSRITCMKSWYWRRKARQPGSFLPPVNLFGPCDASRAPVRAHR